MHPLGLPWHSGRHIGIIDIRTEHQLVKLGVIDGKSKVSQTANAKQILRFCCGGTLPAENGEARSPVPPSDTATYFTGKMMVCGGRADSIRSETARIDNLLGPTSASILRASSSSWGQGCCDIGAAFCNVFAHA